MQRAVLIGSMVIAVAGCGGSNTSTLPSLYEGSWNGTWNGPQTNDGGTLTFTVSADGSVTGTMSRKGGLSGSFGGIINNTGKLTATSAFSGSGNFIISGQVALGSGSLSGSFNYDWLGSEYQGTFSETAQ